jgi:hypothetical protein
LYGVNQTTPLETVIAAGLGNNFSVAVPFQSIVALILDAVPMLDGDFNSDGIVDAADYTVWRDGLGTTYTPEDYDLWKANFGAGAGSGSLAVSVPEPSTLLFCLTGLLWLLGPASRARSQSPAARD